MPLPKIQHDLVDGAAVELKLREIELVRPVGHDPRRSAGLELRSCRNGIVVGRLVAQKRRVRVGRLFESQEGPLSAARPHEHGLQALLAMSIGRLELDPCEVVAPAPSADGGPNEALGHRLQSADR